MRTEGGHHARLGLDLLFWASISSIISILNLDLRRQKYKGP